MHNPASNIPLCFFFQRLRQIFSIMEEWRKWELIKSIYLRNSYSNYLKMYTDGFKNKQECSGRVQEVGREWNLTGILGSEGEGEAIRIIRKALFKFLNYTGLMRRIWAQLKGHDVTHSCTIGGGMHLKVVCNLPLTKRRRRRDIMHDGILHTLQSSWWR